MLLCFVRSVATKCASFSNQPCIAPPTIIDVYPKEPPYYSLAASVNKYDGSFDNIDDPYAQICFPDKVKIISVKYLI